MISKVLDTLLAVAFPFHGDQYYTFFPSFCSLVCLLGYSSSMFEGWGSKVFASSPWIDVGKLGFLLLYILGFVHGGA